MKSLSAIKSNYYKLAKQISAPKKHEHGQRAFLGKPRRIGDLAPRL